MSFIQCIIQSAVALCWFPGQCEETGRVEENWPWHNRWEGDELVAGAPGGGESREVAALQACPNRRIHGQSTHAAPEDSSLITHASMQTQSALLVWAWIQPLTLSSSSWLLNRRNKQTNRNIHTIRLNTENSYTNISRYHWNSYTFTVAQRGSFSLLQHLMTLWVIQTFSLQCRLTSK